MSARPSGAGDGRAVAPGRQPVVVKLGSSSVTTPDGHPDDRVIGQVCADVAELRGQGVPVVVVSSGAVAAGWEALGRAGAPVGEPSLLQAASAVGQPRLMGTWYEALGSVGLRGAQVLLAPLDFVHRQQYLRARSTLSRLLDLGVVPVVNENDAVADDEIRFGDNDRLAALVAHLLRAATLVLLTDAPGLLTADPRRGDGASLIEEVLEIDHQLEAVAGGAGSEVGSGGMASKLAAAKIATWSGVTTVIARADRSHVLRDVVAAEPGVGTLFRPHTRRLAARKLWIAFALRPSGTLLVDRGARRAVEDQGRSLLPAGVVDCRGEFREGDAVEIAGPGDDVFAKGISRYSSAEAERWLGKRRSELAEHLPDEIVHRDDLVVLT